MLTQPEKRRLYDAIPTQFTVEWSDNEYTYDAEKWWANQDDDDMDYPRIVLGWNNREVEREGEQPLNQMRKREVVDKDIKKTKTKRVYDELVIECISDGRVDHDRIPSGEPPLPSFERSDSLASMISTFFGFELDLNEEGPNDERPIIARIAQPPMYVSDMVEGDDADTHQLRVNIHYKKDHVVTEPPILEEELNADASASDS